MDEGFVNTCSELEDHHHCHDGPRSHSSRAVKQSLHEIEEGNKNKCNSHLFRMHKSLWVVCNKSPGVRLEEWSTERTEDTDGFIKHSIMQAFGSRRTEPEGAYLPFQNGYFPFDEVRYPRPGHGSRLNGRNILLFPRRLLRSDFALSNFREQTLERLNCHSIKKL